jgi:hypothetical protein
MTTTSPFLISGRVPKPVYIWAFFAFLLGVVGMGLAWSVSQQAAPKSEAAAIQKVLDQYHVCDQEFKSAKKAQVPSQTNFKEATEKLRRIDVSECPSDFREAHVRFVGAMDRFTLFVAHYPNSFSVAVDMTLKFLGGNRDAGYSKIMDRAQQLQQDLMTCHTEVDALAARYGARLVEW